MKQGTHKSNSPWHRFLMTALTLVLLSPLPVLSTASQEAGSKKGKNNPQQDAEPVNAIKPNLLLKNITYIRTQCRFNGVPYYKGYKHPRDTQMMEFNLEETEAGLKDAGIPIDKDNIRQLYTHTETLLKKAGVRPLDIRPTNRREASVVPEVSLNVDIEIATEDSYVISVYLTVSKWMSAWSGSRSVQAPAIVWWQKKVIVVPPSELTDKISETATRLTEGFSAHFAVANPVSKVDTENKTAAAAAPGNGENEKPGNR